MEKNKILKVYGHDYFAMTKLILEEAKLAEDIIKKGHKNGIIGIKPNMVYCSPPSNGATTHLEPVAALIEYLQEKGINDVRIYEGAWVGDETMRVLKICGYDKLSKKYGVPLIDTKKLGSYRADCSEMELSICDCVKEIDYLINVPVMKGHCQTRVTCALKNMKGLIPDREKRRFHTLNLHEPIAHLNTVIRQDFILVDHICGDLNYEDGGNPVVRNCIMAASDPVLMDSYVCALMGYKTSQVPYVEIAASLGVGSTDLSRANVRVFDHQIDAPQDASNGRFIDLFGDDICDEAIPDTSRILELIDAVDAVDSCSACYGYLIPALDRIRAEGNFQKLMEVLPGRICIGQGYRGCKGAIGVGNCTNGFEKHIPGCPPTGEEIYDYLMGLL